MSVHSQTPSMSPSRLASQLSYHITLLFPSSLPSLHSLTTSASQWRHLGSPSLSSLHFHHLSLATTNAPLDFPSLSAGQTTLKTANAPIEGTYSLHSLELGADNSKISGSYTVETSARIKTSNRPIEGTFEAEELELRTSNGKIGGQFTGTRKLKVETVNRGIEGKYRVGGEVWIKTCNGAIEGDIEVLSSAEGRGRESTPPLLAEDVKKSGGGAVDGPRITGEAKTANAIIDLRFLGPPKGTEVQFAAKSANKMVMLSYPGAFDGSFYVSSTSVPLALAETLLKPSLRQASTSNGQALITVPTSHTVSYDDERTKGKHLSGRIASGGDGGAGDVGGSSGGFKVESSNAEVGVRIV